MSSVPRPPDDGGASLSPGWKTLIAAVVLYAASLAIATYPMVWNLDRAFAGSPTDPLHSLRNMRWYKTCLLEGRSPLLCRELQYPIGAPLGYSSPTTLQSLIYLPLSFITDNDLLCVNIIWILGFLTTGMGTLLLAWHVLRDRACAVLAGLLAMLSTPMMMHGHGHLELIYPGNFAFFLIAWMRFVDRPGRGRLVAAVLFYLLLSMSSPYFAPLSIFPAAWYVGYRSIRAGWRGVLPWLRSRSAWLLGFAALVGPCLGVLFIGQIWSMVRGDPVSRPRTEFSLYGAPLWGYFTPTEKHALTNIMPFNAYEAAGIKGIYHEVASYPGVVALVLAGYAAVYGVRFRRKGFWWSVLAVVVVLSFGAWWRFGTHKVELPASWIWRWFFAFRLIRVPARFNLFACILIALVAAAGLRHLLARIPYRAPRALVYMALLAIAVADLAMVPFPVWAAPEMPACYAMLKERAPKAAIYEIPQALSGGFYLNAASGYWQSFHRVRTTGGYTAHFNVALDNLLMWNSPFSSVELAKPDFLVDPDSQTFADITRARFADYAWLFLTVHRLDFVVLHQWENVSCDNPVNLGRLKPLLEPAKIYEDQATAVYDRTRFQAPTRPVMLCTEGWRPAFDDRAIRVVEKSGGLAIYNPDAGRELRLTLQAKAFRKPRTVRLMAGDVELTRWEFQPGQYQAVESGPFRLPAGLQRLTLASDGEERPKHRRERAVEADLAPFSLRVAEVNLAPGLSLDPPSSQVASRPEPNAR